MAWLLKDGEVLASLEVAETGRERRRGLLGRDHLDGALLLRPARWVHTIGMRFPIDVIHCDGDFNVLRVTTMRRNRLGRPVLKARAVIEAEAGAAGRWSIEVGDSLELKGE